VGKRSKPSWARNRASVSPRDQYIPAPILSIAEGQIGLAGKVALWACQLLRTGDGYQPEIRPFLIRGSQFCYSRQRLTGHFRPRPPKTDQHHLSLKDFRTELLLIRLHRFYFQLGQSFPYQRMTDPKGKSKWPKMEPVAVWPANYYCL